MLTGIKDDLAKRLAGIIDVLSQLQNCLRSTQLSPLVELADEFNQIPAKVPPFASTFYLNLICISHRLQKLG